jgi:hypothetical protein
MFLIVAGCAVAGNGGLKRFQRVENRVWPETLPVIDFDVSEADSAVPGDYICRGYRQLPTRVTVGSRQCLVIRSQGGTQLPPVARTQRPKRRAARDRVSPYVRQPEIGSTSFNPDGRLESEAGPKLLDLGLVEGRPPCRSRAQGFRLEVSKLLIQPHSGTLPGCLASRATGPGGLKPCPGVVF